MCNVMLLCYTVFLEWLILCCCLVQSKGGAGVKDMVQAGVLDLFLNRQWGIKLACNAACTVLRVDQVKKKQHTLSS